MLTRYLLGNFKAFAELQDVPVRPLTLIFGSNSSGKSSLMHGLLLAQYAAQTGRFDVSLIGNGSDVVDLGGFQQYAFAGRTDLGVRIGLEFSLPELPWQLRTLSAGSLRLSLDISVGYIATPDMSAGSNPRVGIRQVIVAVDGGEFLRFSHRNLPQDDFTESGRSYSANPASPYEYRLDTLNTGHPAALMFITQAAATHSRVTPLSRGHLRFAQTVIDELLPRVAFRRLHLLPVYPGTAKKTADRGPQFSGDERRIAGNLTAQLPRLLSRLMEQTDVVSRSTLSRLQYLGPLRTLPERHVALVGPESTSGSEVAWIRLRQDPALRDRVNRWLRELQTRHQVYVRELAAVDHMCECVSANVTQATQAVIQKCRADGTETFSVDQIEQRLDVEWDNVTRNAVRKAIQSSALRVYPQLLLEDERNKAEVSFRDVGVGISQVLPVLVYACSETRGLIAIEQPELHLHPALQADLGDVFIESALGDRKNTFLLETHSEHLILRILRRVRETTENRVPQGGVGVRPEDVTVLYVEATPSGAVLRHLPVTADGDFGAQWPGGFFAERLKDLP